jgi:hypothetical protein
MQYCCTQFQSLVDNAGNKGFAVVHAVHYGQRRFWLQVRPCEATVYEHLSPVDPATGRTGWPDLKDRDGHSHSMGVVLNQNVDFCPLCAHDLQLLIYQQAAEFDRLSLDPHALWNF